MPTPCRSVLLAAICLTASCLAEADVTVRFDHPEDFSDLSLSAGSPEKNTALLTQQIEGHLKWLGQQYLPKGDTVDIVITDIDMAGGFERWRIPDGMWTRIISDVYPPKIKLQYVWKDASGKIKGQQAELVTDLNYRSMVGYKQFPTQDSLRYEKALLQRWFRRAFAVDGKPLFEQGSSPQGSD
ncbi:MAG: DUF3016 domain-containing protein [Methylococcaceae bacterium]|nr:DUF3016 domain-containing protein [Methylococcaceae bacterium]